MKKYYYDVDFGWVEASDDEYSQYAADGDIPLMIVENGIYKPPQDEFNAFCKAWNIDLDSNA